jgi:hypothetical protein
MVWQACTKSPRFFKMSRASLSEVTCSLPMDLTLGVLGISICGSTSQPLNTSIATVFLVSLPVQPLKIVVFFLCK